MRASDLVSPPSIDSLLCQAGIKKARLNFKLARTLQEYVHQFWLITFDVGCVRIWKLVCSSRNFSLGFFDNRLSA